MYGGYGGGMGPMYGGGLSSMCGGYAGGMGSMYGGGLGSMYSGGLSTYGGYGGGMGPMYGGGLSSAYGGGLASMGGMTNGMTGGMNAVSTLPNGQGTNSLLPPQSNQLQMGPSHVSATEELPRERRARQRRERRRELEEIEKYRQQKKQFAIRSTIEIVGHVLQVVAQVMRSGLELFGVGFGTYYSVQAVKALVKSQDSAVSHTVAQQGVATAGTKMANGKIIHRVSNWKMWLLICALFMVMETIYSVHQRYLNARLQQAVHRGERRMLNTDEDDSLEESLSQSEECSSDKDSTLESLNGSNKTMVGIRRRRWNKSKHIYVAVYDYESPDSERFIGFRAGDRFVIEDYVENGWCEAISMNDVEGILGEGLVPGNFLRPLEGQTKL